MASTVGASPFTARIGRIEISATMAINNDATTLRAQGVDLVDFGAGEPHFATPEHIKLAAIEAIQKNFTKYTAVAGIKELREAIAARHEQDFGSSYSWDETIVTTGGKNALFNTFQVLIDHGDEVIIPVPYWVSFKDMVEYCGGKCAFVQTRADEGFRLTAAMVEKAITPRTRIILLNIAQQPLGRGRRPGGFDRHRQAGGLARNLRDERRVLRLSGLHRPAVLAGFAHRVQGFAAADGLALQDLFHDRMAAGLCHGAQGGHRPAAEAAEPVHVEPDLDCAEGRTGRSDRLAAVRGRDARRIHPAARPHRGRAARHSRRQVQPAARARSMPSRTSVRWPRAPASTPRR